MRSNGAKTKPCRDRRQGCAWGAALLKAPQGLRRRHPRRSDRGARRREDSAKERDAAKKEQPVPRDDEGSLVRKETQIQIVRKGDAQGNPEGDSRQRDERELN